MNRITDITYQYPTKNDINYAIKNGWSKEDAERGFCICDFEGLGLYEINAIFEAHIETYNSYDDELAAREAERIGYCKIIPVDELPNPFGYFTKNDRRYFGWIDTPENRKNIKEYCDKYCK